MHKLRENNVSLSFNEKLGLNLIPPKLTHVTSIALYLKNNKIY